MLFGINYEIPGETTEISEKSDSGDKLNQIRYFTFELWMKKKEANKQTTNWLIGRWHLGSLPTKRKTK